MPTKCLHWLVTLPQMQEKMFNRTGVSDNRKPGHNYNHHPEEVPDSAIVSHTLEAACLSHWGGTTTFHPFPCLTVLHIPLGELGHWLHTPVQDKAEQS